MFVQSGKSLTIPAGTTLRFHDNAFLVVDGTLTMQGTSGNPGDADFRTSHASARQLARHLLRAGTGSLIEYAHIEWATTGVNVTGVTATFRNNTIRNFTDQRRLRRTEPAPVARSSRTT